MRIDRRTLLGTAAAASLPLARARAQGAPIKIGVLTDLSGPYKDLAGPVAVSCVQQALEDFGAAGKGMKIEVVSADHQNKPDIGAGIAGQWYDRDGVDIIVEVANSGVALAVAGVAKAKNKVYINSGAATSDLSGAQCNVNTIHWAYDTYMLAKSTGAALAKAGGDSWYFITADYAFGKALQRDTTEFVTAAGGKVLGSSAYPFPGTTDFSSLLLQAQSSRAKVLGLCNAGTDTINSIKQAKEFGLKMQIAGLLLFISDVHSLGLETAQGIAVTDSFYWDMNDRSRAFSERLKPKAPTVRPTMVQAGDLFEHAALPQTRRRDGRRDQGRRCGHRRAPEGDADRRRLFRPRQDPRGRPQDPPELSLGDQEARREQGAVGLLQGGRDHAGRSGVPAAQRGPLPHGQGLRIRT